MGLCVGSRGGICGENLCFRSAARAFPGAGLPRKGDDARLPAPASNLSSLWCSAECLFPIFCALPLGSFLCNGHYRCGLPMRCFRQGTLTPSILRMQVDMGIYMDTHRRGGSGRGDPTPNPKPPTQKANFLVVYVLRLASFYDF